jgi:hypothetical protein
MNKDLKNEPDSKLIEIINTALPAPDKIPARIELHSRQKKANQLTNIMTFLILVFTLAIFALTLMLVLKECGVLPISKPHGSALVQPQQ